MTDRKQSAHARREARKLQGITTSVDNTTINNFNTFVSETNQNIANINNQLTNVNTQTSSTTIALNNQLNPFDTASWESRITELENNPSTGGGSGGIDPSDPDQPLIIVENFLSIGNGNAGDGGIVLYTYPEMAPTTLNPNGFLVKAADSETDHPGIIKLVVNDGDYINTYGYYLGARATEPLILFSSLSTLILIFKTPVSSTNIDIRFGLLSDFLSTTPNGIYFERLAADSTFFAVTRNSGTQTRTNTSITYSNNTWYTLKIARTLSNTVDFTINSTTVNNTTNIPSAALNPGFQAIDVDNFTVGDTEFKLDFFSLKLGDIASVLPTGTTVEGTANEVEVTTVGSVITIGLPSAIIVSQATVDKITFTMGGTSPTLSMGELAWDPDHNGIVYQLSSTIHAPLGTSVYQRVHNSSGTNIVKGEIVYVSGSHGTDRLLVAKAKADAEATSAPTVGVAAENIITGSDGYIVTYGLLTQLNTIGYTAGDRIYLSETTAGAWRINSIPSAPNHGTFVGWVVKVAGAGAGSIFVKVHNYNELSELSDVYVPSNPTTNDVLQWTASNRWENKSLSSAGIAAASHTHTLSALTPLNATTLVGRWAGAGSGIAQEVTIGNGLKLSTGGVLATNSAQVVDTTTQINTGTGLLGGGDLTTNRTISVDFAASGTSSSTKAVRADDSRLSDARTPLTHVHDGADITTGTIDTARLLVGSAISTVCAGNDSRLSDARTPLSHTHGNITNAGAIGSTANLPVITTTSGVLTTGTFGTAANTFCQGNDSRLSNTRAPSDGNYGDIIVSGSGTVMTISGGIHQFPKVAPLTGFDGYSPAINGTAASSITTVINRLYLIPWVAPSDFTITVLRTRSVTAVASATVYMAIYASGSDGYPTGSPLVNSTALAAATANTDISFSTSLAVTENQQYWFAIGTPASSPPNIRSLSPVALPPLAFSITNGTAYNCIYRTWTPGTWANFTTNPVVTGDLANATTVATIPYFVVIK